MWRFDLPMFIVAGGELITWNVLGKEGEVYSLSLKRQLNHGIV